MAYDRRNTGTTDFYVGNIVISYSHCSHAHEHGQERADIYIIGGTAYYMGLDS
jgi:uncharacterized RmlC-like cupin family protein